MTDINKLLKAKDIVKTIQQNILSSLTKNEHLPIEKQLDILVQINELDETLNKININRPDHGKKPQFGYIDKDGTIPYVKTEAVMDYLARTLKLSRHNFRKHNIWKNFKTYLKDVYGIEHVWKHVHNVHGVMVVYVNIDYDTLINITNQFLAEENLGGN